MFNKNLVLKRIFHDITAEMIATDI